MAINFSSFNGTSPYVDAAKFETDIKAVLGPTAKNAQVFLMNNFPIDVSTDTAIDFLLIIALQKADGNYFYVKHDQRNAYVHNLIMPVRVISSLKNVTLTEEDGYLRADDELLDYEQEMTALSYGLRDYLASKCKFNKDELFITPLTFVINGKQAVAGQTLSSATFSAQALLFYLKNCPKDIFIAYKSWMTHSYDLISQDIKRIVEQASIDSKFGYITKSKIDRMSERNSSAEKIFNEINTKLVIINGKAGTGKTSEIIRLMMRCVEQGRNAIFLTYNKLLVNDIAKVMKSYISSKAKELKDERGEQAVITLHKFMRKIAKSLGVLHLMSDARITEIEELLIQRSKAAAKFIREAAEKSNLSRIDFRAVESLKSKLQQSQLGQGMKEIGIDLLNFLKKRHLEDLRSLDEYLELFIDHKKELLANIEADKVFLADYYGVLVNVLMALRSPKELYDKYDVSSKFELLEGILKLKRSDDKDGKQAPELNEAYFLSKLNRRAVSNRRRRTLFVDEAQDCHPNEREILITLFGRENVVVASGGYEQLIRHVELCRWNYFEGRQLLAARKKRKPRPKNEDAAGPLLFDTEGFFVELDEQEEADHIEVIEFNKPPVTFRVKKTILEFCNYFAAHCGVNLSLSPIETDDEGEIIFDFRKDSRSEATKEEMDKLLYKGNLYGCTPYESLLLLIDAEARMVTNIESCDNNSGAFSTATINEYGNIEDSLRKVKKEWTHKTALEEDMILWDGAVDDKNELLLPSPNECRMLYYESCRGLEAWSVACFKLDRFFEQKKNHPDAEKFLIENERMAKMQDMEVTNEERKTMFAGTWTLMALTRAMDSLYISVDNPNSEFGKLVLEYIQRNPRNVKALI